MNDECSCSVPANRFTISTVSLQAEQPAVKNLDLVFRAHDAVTILLSVANTGKWPLFLRLVCNASAESVGNCSSEFRAWRTIFSVS